MTYKKHKISTQLSAGFAVIVLITISVISLTANLLINRQFEKYVAKQRETFASQLITTLLSQYNSSDQTWNLDYIHGVGMYALKDGYIIKVYDKDKNIIWDAENHDMTLCHQIMDDIHTNMEKKRPDLKGSFSTHHYTLSQDDTIAGYADISYYGPYYFSESDFQFLGSLNWILLFTGISSLILAVIAGMFLARRLSIPLTKATAIAGKIAEGNYHIRYGSNEAHTPTLELAQLGQAIDHMAENLEKQEEIRRQLTSDVAHELRTPVANVSSHLEAMIEEVWEPTKERLQSCYNELGRISSIISDLEKLRQIESANMVLEKEPVDLFELAQAVKTAFEPELAKKKLTCTVTGEPAILSGDQKRLHQVIFNLVSNAVKYSTENGQIQIDIHNISENVQLTVKDQGIGIAKEDISLIFERFYRTDRSRNRKTGGAGIGLTIAKAIVLAHGGSISVESEEGCGSCFTVALPKGHFPQYPS